MKRMEEEVMGIGVVQICNLSPTHYHGQTIDHVFITSSLIPADFYISCFAEPSNGTEEWTTTHEG